MSGALYHMVEKSRWEEHVNNTPTSLYFPQTYKVDGFTHAAKHKERLLMVANQFYTDSKADWIVLEINEKKLSNEVKYESPAPVGDKQSNPEWENQLFPHIYGGIDVDAVTNTFPLLRDGAGKFVGIQ
eukprot:TRINITY_DN4220_c0_g1_i1.p1 TRINITY_DN4220_c0_g1~~TRINITY_DN4220_c0_g1_i1.p1  ORF type:complete len:128 (-),score=27.63 TRINITY_DN4220_c0_g1_i1:33-416(-)